MVVPLGLEHGLVHIRRVQRRQDRTQVTVVEWRAPVSLTVGQELWFVHREDRSGAPRTVTVTKVGRKWASIDYWGLRVDINTLVAQGNGYASPGRCWINREAWDAELEREAAWSKLRKYVDRAWRPPAGLSKDQIENMLAALPQS